MRHSPWTHLRPLGEKAGLGVSVMTRAAGWQLVASVERREGTCLLLHLYITLASPFLYRT